MCPAYATDSASFEEQLAVQIFISYERDPETQQALRWACTMTLHDALAYAVEFEAAEQASRGQRGV